MSEIVMGTMPTLYNNGDYQDITLSITEECNLRCKYCYMVHKNTYKVMSFETGKKIIDFILSQKPKKKASVWNFIGGEPTLEMDLIDALTDYIKIKMYQMNHPWHKNHMFYIGTNGVLYGSEKLQRYISKNKNRLDVEMTIDGTKRKHDLQRVRKDGSGSYDEIIKNLPLWYKQFPGTKFTKVTFSSDDLCYLKESIIHLWEIGITLVSANVVFEDVWKPGDDKIFEEQLRELADYVLDNRLWNKYSVRFFDPNVGFQMSEKDREVNYCGAGNMMAFDTEGNLYPCIRFLDFCLTSKNESGSACIGNCNTGIDINKLRPFESLSTIGINDEECNNCEIASGCASCSGMNYDDTNKRTIYHRAKYICPMQKAQVRVNKYFWKRYSEITGEISPYEHNRLKQYRGASWKLPGLKFLYFILEDQIKPHCNYIPIGNKCMSEQIFETALAYANEKNMVPVFLGNPENYFPGKVGKQINIKIVSEAEKITRETELDNIIHLVDETDNIEDSPVENSTIYLLDGKNLGFVKRKIEQAVKDDNCQYINLIKKDFLNWSFKEVEEYKLFLLQVQEIIKKNKKICNLFLDSDTQERMDCKAGVESFAVAPNGYIYACPAFYYHDSSNYICKVGDEIIPQREFQLEYSLLCKECKNKNCRRCVFDHYIATGDISTPSYRQCELAEVENIVMNKEK